MTNNELCLKIINDLCGKYLLGLHNINKDAYVFKSLFDSDKFNIDESMVSEKRIIDSIFKKGLYVPECSIGLKSTVTFFDKIVPNVFNYAYYSDIGDKVYVVIVAIPKYICLNGDKYFISDMIEYTNMANYVLFHKLLPKEFIYGYYVKDVRFVKTENKTLTYKCIFDDKLEFCSNDDFFGYMSSFEKESFLINYFKDNNIDISLLNKMDCVCMVKNAINTCNVNLMRRQLIRRKNK